MQHALRQPRPPAAVDNGLTLDWFLAVNRPDGQGFSGFAPQEETTRGQRAGVLLTIRMPHGWTLRSGQVVFRLLYFAL